MKLNKIFTDKFRNMLDGFDKAPPCNPVENNQSCAVAIGNELIAALSHDRVWCPRWRLNYLPEDIGFNCGTDRETLIWLKFLTHEIIGMEFDGEPEYEDFHKMASKIKTSIDKGEDPSKALSGDRKSLLLASYAWVTQNELSGTEYFDKSVYPKIGSNELKIASEYILPRQLSAEIQQKLGGRVVPIYNFRADFDLDFKVGSEQILNFAIEKFEIVDQEKLSLEQVIEFRCDEQSKRNYRNMLHWVDGELLSKEANYVVDEIGARIDSYKLAIEKHGLKTRMGLLESVLDPSSLIPAATMATGLTFSGLPIWGALSAGSIMFGKMMVSLGKSKVDLYDVEKESSNIAFVLGLDKEYK